MPDLTHDQLMAIVAIAAAPAVWQAVVQRVVHPLWIATAMIAGILAVIAW